MNKTERLILLLRHLKNQSRTSLKEISGKFDVSERTVYRDLNTLSYLGFEVNLKQGYTVHNEVTESALGQFSETEIRLLVFALRTNFLGKIFPFEELADRIEKIYGSNRE